MQCRIVKMQVEQVRYITLSIKDKYIKDLKKYKIEKRKGKKKRCRAIFKNKKNLILVF